MSPAERTSHVYANFKGARSAVAPLTWGQQTIWDDIQYFMPKLMSFYFVRRRLPVPDGMELDDVVGQLEELMNRHESLRTHFDPATDGTVFQRLVQSGSVKVRVADCEPEQFAHTSDQIFSELVGETMDNSVELPFRPAVVLRAGRPAAVLFSVSHLAADEASANLLSSELSGLLASARAGASSQPSRRAMQPVDLAAFEQSEPGRKMNAAAMAHLRERLLAMSPSMFGPPTSPEAPRYQRAVLASTTLPPALQLLAERYRSTTTFVLLTAATVALYGITNEPRCTLKLMYNNRSNPDLKFAVTNLCQAPLAAIDVLPGSFAQALARSFTAAFAAYRYGRFSSLSALAMTEKVAAERGTALDITCRFNDMWSFAAPAGVVPQDDAAVPEQTRSTQFSWLDGVDDEQNTMLLDVAGYADLIRIHLLADTSRVPPEWIRRLLVGIETVVMTLSKREASVAELASSV